MTDQPILTIITRHLANRVEAFDQLNKTLDPFRDVIQHIVYVDDVGLGWLECSKVLEEKKDGVDGYYVWILDDDDVCTSPTLTSILACQIIKHDPDVILVRNMLSHPHLGNTIFPSDELWNAKEVPSLTIGSMGSSNIIVKNQIYKDYIKYFATVDRREHDWFYLEAVLKEVMEERFSLLWLDELVMRQLKSNRGG